MLKGVFAISASDAWAVGLTQTSDNRWVSLTMHWDGSHWNIVSSPSPDGDAPLSGVSAASASDVWAVGTVNASPTGCGPHCLTLAMHWDGSSWTVVPTPNPSSGYLNALLGVAVIAGDERLGGRIDRLREDVVHPLGRKFLAVVRSAPSRQRRPGSAGARARGAADRAGHRRGPRCPRARCHALR